MEAAMRGIASYLLAGVFVVLALDIVAPPAGLGFSPVGASPSAVNNVPLQSVDRSNKGDRFQVTTVGKTQPKNEAQQQQPPKMLSNCDPAFSPLSAQARANFARSCAA
jgi:hypothetical protein